MKDILIIVPPSTSEHDQAYRAIEKEAEKQGKDTLQLFTTSFLLTGPKCFGNAMSIMSIADREKIQTAVFEVESCLRYPDEGF